ncbi:MAG TPA: glycosyltransferase, partial [Thermoanaerobaculia bacterium]|nr:glycosyltransferase [Thermoanaerobaculia bacterium]
RPWTIARHTLAPVARAVEELVAARGFDLVHAEQLQALPQAEPARRRGLPALLRAQNVESDLWGAAGRASSAGIAAALGTESRRLARWEGRAVHGAARTLALTEGDAERLRELSGGEGRVEVLAAPFPERLSAGGRPLQGEPAVVLLEGSGWRPNRVGAEWFRREVWPRLRAELPRARLHVFGGASRRDEADGVHRYPAPADSAAAFPEGSVLAVPLRIASGVRIKVLEAWARGVPVVGTPEALAGLGVRDGVEAMVAGGAGPFAAAFARLAGEPGLAAALIAGGRAALAARHDPRRLARELLEIYADVAAAPSSGLGRRRPPAWERPPR